MANQHKASTWFVYVSTKQNHDQMVYFSEFNGLGKESEKEAMGAAADLIAKGSRVLVTTESRQTPFAI